MTNSIVFITVVLSIIAIYNREFMGKLIFNPYMISDRKQWWRFITSGFIHADWIHLGINMLVLWSFGNVVENYYNAIFETKGIFNYLLLYFGAIVVSITPSYKRNLHNAGYNALGASGAVSAVLFTAILFRPLDKIYLYGIIGIPGIILGVAYLAYSYYMNKKGGGFINHDAHMWGAIFGIIFTLALKPSIALHFIDQLTNF